MNDSILRALKSVYNGVYAVDFSKNSCEIFYSAFLPAEYTGRTVSIQRFMDACKAQIEENYKYKVDEFFDRAALRNAFIKDETYNIVYAASMTKDGTYKLFKTTMFPEAADKGMICSNAINAEINAMIQPNNQGNDGFRAGILRIKNNPQFTVEYASDWFFETLGYSREQMKNQFRNSLNRIVLDDFEKGRKHAEIQRENYSEFNLRLRHRSGSTVWVHNICTYQQEEAVFTIVMLDITDDIKKEQDTRARDEMYRAILENLDLVYFVYDVGQDLMTINISNDQGCTQQKQIPDYLQTINENTLIHPQDIKVIRTAFSRVLRKAEGKECFECRTAIRGAGYKWSRTSMTAINDAEGNLYQIIGRIDNIEQEIHHKEEESRWKEIAERDSLTGLFSREAGVGLIEEMINKGESKGGALFLLDVDNFKDVNDTEGHLEGDSLLRSIAQVFVSQFRSEDVVCRYGGDEMLAFIPGISEINVIRRKSDSILKAVRCIDRGDRMPITCSIGISIKKPGEEISYETMFRNADIALYSAKNHEKNCGYIFDQ